MDRLGFRHCGESGEPYYWFEVLINGAPLDEFFRPAVITLDTDRARSILPNCCEIPYDMFYRCACEEQSVVDDFLVRAKESAWFVTAYDQVALEQSDELRLILSICGCGEWGCGWTSARVRMTEQLIRWSEFDYSEKFQFELPELIFDRDQYLEAIRDVYRTMGSIPIRYRK